MVSPTFVPLNSKPSLSLNWTSILSFTSRLEWNNLQIQCDLILLYLFKVISYHSPISSFLSYIVSFYSYKILMFISALQPLYFPFSVPRFSIPRLPYDCFLLIQVSVQMSPIQYSFPITLAKYHNPLHHYYRIHCTFILFYYSTYHYLKLYMHVFIFFLPILPKGTP